MKNLKSLFKKLYTSKFTNKDTLVDSVIDAEEYSFGKHIPNRIHQRLHRYLVHKKIYLGAFALVLASFLGNFLNFLYNSYLGRVLNYYDFRLIGLMTAIYSFATIFFGAFSSTTNYRSALIIGKFGNEAAHEYWRVLRKKVFVISTGIAVLWILSIPVLMRFFQQSSPFFLLIFSPILLIGLVHSFDKSYISAKFQFGSLALVYLIDPVVRIFIAVCLVFFDIKYWTFTAIPIAVFCAFILAWFLITFKNKSTSKKIALISEEYRFPFNFFYASLLSAFSSTAFSILDIILANHYLSSVEAGKYTLLSLIGKMIFFMGGLTTPFIIPLLSRIEGANKSPEKMMYILVIFTGILSFMSFICFGLFGYITLPILYGKKISRILPYVILYTFAMVAFTTGRVFINYYLIKKVYSFTLLTSFLIILQVGLLMIFHSSYQSFAVVMSGIWLLFFVLTLLLHIFVKYTVMIEKKTIDSFRYAWYHVRNK